MEPSTSTVCLDAIQREGLADTQRNAIRAFLDSHYPKEFTRKEIAGALGMEPGSVCGRVDELIDFTCNQAVESIRRKCAISGRTVKTVRANRGNWQEVMIFKGEKDEQSTSQNLQG
jgi:hypothetical protein